ncbi:FKBP-type peptidyl-prolyl cis-trans isomerase [Pedobacter cryoconitis]|uniref:Peptidyl-prolyl cis-trans isomerase n=1 Tax=Pedobacter cryoconitis TaxID=188932 RepID=A0A7X0MJD9_9SPHI|nr:FKBP-type peptidyl-prolyl cis-trans isomerase [Pedobacter cryoconitis]MBB6501377.1 FKBP-type peptidyl-prolyl cis-trans isomerase [Pedobacter cryoconitis]
MLKKLSQFALALIGLTVLFSSCKKDYESIQSVDTKKIQDYITANNLTVIPDSAATGYFYQIKTAGTGTANFKLTDSVLYQLTVKGLENGTVYWETPSTANLGTYVGYTNGLISTDATIASISVPAIRDVMLKLKPGGSARILLPSYLAYGKNGSGGVPSNENIDLLVSTFPEKVQQTLDDRLINDFIKKNSLTMTKDPSRVYYSISTPGTGVGGAITMSSTLVINYTGRYLDGTVFQTNVAGTFTSTLASLVKGWGAVIPGKITAGGKMRILIPSDLGYGSTLSNGIPGNSVLDFDIEIVSVAN